MNNRNNFTVYLPSNSPGSTPLIASESKEELSQSFFKTTLDTTIDLDGDDWEVGLAEVCHPSDLVSILGDVHVGACIVNPPKHYIKEVRKEFIGKLADDQKSKPVEEEFDKTEQDIDYGWMLYGKQTADMQIQVKKANDFFEGADVRFEEEETFNHHFHVTAADGKTIADDAFPEYANPGHGDPCEGLEMRIEPGIVSCENEDFSGPSGSPTLAERNKAADQATEQAGDQAAGDQAAATPLLPTAELQATTAFYLINAKVISRWNDTLSKLETPLDFASHVRGNIIPKAIGQSISGNVEVSQLVSESAPDESTYSVKAPDFVKSFSDEWYRRKPFEVAMGKRLHVEHDQYRDLGKIRKGFYNSRSELVTIINQRLRLILAQRSYPNIEWKGFWFEPLLQANDDGTVTVKTGFYEPLSGLDSTPFIHVVPMINSLRALQFLGLDTKKWKWSTKYTSFLFDINNGCCVSRRDSKKPIEVPQLTNAAYRVFAMEKAHVRKIVNKSELAMLMHESKQLGRHLLESWYPTDMQLSSPTVTIPNLLYVYVDVAAPVCIGNTKASVVRIVSLKHKQYNYAKAEEKAIRWANPIPSTAHADDEETTELWVRLHTDQYRSVQNEPERFNNIIYSPLSRKTFSTITVFLSDEHGSTLHFNGGMSYIVLHFRRPV